jgi:hypothetical protein
MKPEEMTEQVIDQMLGGINDFKLEDDWERDFLNSIREWWKKKRMLSEKQKRRLLEIWEAQNDSETR